MSSRFDGDSESECASESEGESVSERESERESEGRFKLKKLVNHNDPDKERRGNLKQKERTR